MSKDTIRNVRAFMKSYFKSPAGKSALNPAPRKVTNANGKTTLVHKNNSMALALYEAAHV